MSRVLASWFKRWAEALACRLPVEYAVIASGFNISGNVDLTQRTIEAIFVPTMGSSGDLTVQGNVDTTSARFVRLMDSRVVSQAALRFPVGVGSVAIPWPLAVIQPAYARFEMITATGSLQTDNRTLTLVTRPR